MIEFSDATTSLFWTEVLRNVFDQYQQPENRLTHALMVTLDRERNLLTPFLKFLGVCNAPTKDRLTLTEQRLPGDANDEASALTETGLPDGAIFDAEGWAVIIESKVQAKLTKNQLVRHIKTTEARGYQNPQLVAITVDEQSSPPLPGCIYITWREIYAWFAKRVDRSEWAGTFVEYMRVFEQQMLWENYQIRGTITMFDGFHFSRETPYTYSEGKRLIKLLRQELIQHPDLHAMGVDPKGKGRGAITGQQQAGVWDYMPLMQAKDFKNFTDLPHLTLSIHRDHAQAAITIPNGVKGGFKKKLQNGGVEAFRELLCEIEGNLRPIVAKSTKSKPWMYALQRHYRSQSAPATEDGSIGADIRTIIKGNGAKVKYQPQWCEAIYELLANKRSNIQFGVVMRFNYDCPIIQSEKATGLFVAAFQGMSPVVDFVLND